MSGADKAVLDGKSGSLSGSLAGSLAATTLDYGDAPPKQASIPRRVVDSFRRDPHAHTTPPGFVGADGKVFDVEYAIAATADSPLARQLKGRHLQMIAIGGSIGEFWGTLVRSLSWHGGEELGGGGPKERNRGNRRMSRESEG